MIPLYREIPVDKGFVNPAEPDLQDLEHKVDELLRAHAQLAQENRALRRQYGIVTQEHKTLVDKFERARRRVDGMIRRLRVLEDGT